ncbi:MAG: hypothetical protein ACREBU_10165 [Nitrososphaera sp.]
MQEENRSPHLPEENQDHSTISTQPVDKFVNPGILLFADQLLTAAGGWIYWLIISKFVLTEEIGHATTIYSLVLLVNMIAQMGLEYPLLKKSIAHRQRIFGSVALIESIITAASIPIILYSTGTLYQESSEFTWIAIGILVFSSLGFVSRFALLGLSMPKTLLIFDVVGTVLKFGSAFALVSAGYGALGILLSFLIQAIVITCGTTFMAARSFGFGLGNISFIKEAFRDGLVNMPSKLSGMLVISLSVVLLASLGIASSDVGVFYIALMVSIVVGSFASSLAFMSIPASSAVNRDLSSGSLRIGLAFTAPVIAALIVAPNLILSFIGTEYTKASEILVVLAAGILPSVILSNAMSKFNNQNQPRKLLAIGSLRIGMFLVAFYILVPQLGILGAAYAILISFSTSAILSIVWSGKESLRFVGVSLLSIIAAVLAGTSVTMVAQDYPLLAVGVSIAVSLFIMFTLRCTSTKEIAAMIASVKRV